MTKANAKKLPRWATFEECASKSIDSSISFTNVVQQEELTLRTKAYHHTCSKIVKNSFDTTLDKSLNEKVFLPLYDFMKQFQPVKKNGINLFRIANNDILPSSDINDDDEANQTEADRMMGSREKHTKKKRKLSVGGRETTRKDAISVLNISSLQEELKQQTQTREKKYHPTLLPIGIMHVPPSILDRQEIIQSFIQQFDKYGKQRGQEHFDQKSNENDYIPLICVLKETDMTNLFSSSLSSKSQQRSHIRQKVDSYLSNILTQCMSFNPIHIPKSNKSSSSTADKIIFWARHNTSRYNSILILISNPELISMQQLHILIYTLSELRSVHGVPISILFCCYDEDFIQKELLSNLDSQALNGQVGIVVEEFHTITSKLLVDKFIANLYHPDNAPNIDASSSKTKQFSTPKEHTESTMQHLPIVLGSDIMRMLREEFDHHHGSYVMYVKQMKMALAHHFVQKGTFLTLINDKLFMNQFGSNLSWFCVDFNARRRMIADMITLQTDNEKCDNNENKNEEKSKRRSNIMKNSHVFISTIQDIHDERHYAILICKVVNVIATKLRKNNSMCHLSKEDSDEKQNQTFSENKNNIEACLMKSSQYKFIIKKILEFVRKATANELIDLFGACIEEINNHITNVQRLDVMSCFSNESFANEYKEESHTHKLFKSKRVMKLMNFFNESVILIDSMSDGSDDMKWDLREWLVEELSSIIWHKSSEVDNASSLLPLVFYGGDGHKDHITASFKSSINTHPRRGLASTITHLPMTGLSAHDDFSVDVMTTFTTFDSRIILINEWFQRFIESHPNESNDDSNMVDLVHRFAFSVYQLMLCGLVVRSRRREDTFEKGAMVWATVN